MEGTLTMADPRHDWGPLVGDLAARKARALEMGGEKLVERQRSLGKLTVRDRLDLLVAPGTWVEYGLLADHMDAGLGDRYLAADGAITGVGEIDGRPVAVYRTQRAMSLGTDPTPGAGRGAPLPWGRHPPWSRRSGPTEPVP